MRPAESVAWICRLTAVPTVPDWLPGFVTVTVVPVAEPNWMSSTACSSMPLGATPVWPCRKSKKPTPVTVTGTFAAWKVPVGVYFASNSLRAFSMLDSSGLDEPTQAGSGISAIIVLPDASAITR